MRKLRYILIGVLVIALILCLFILCFKENSTEYTPSKGALSSEKDNEQVNQQADNEALILNHYKKKNYSIKDPYVVVNPYGTSPLSALVMFTTDKPTQITVTVKGTNPHTTIKKTISGYKTKHEIPVLGLYPNKANEVSLQAKNKKGQNTEKTLSIQTGALPNDFLQTTLVTSKPDKMEKGLTFLTPSSKYAYAVDSHGDVRWYSTLSNEHVFQRLKNGNILFAAKKAGQYKELLEMDLLGKVYNAYTINVKNYTNSDVIHHDAIQLPNGNFLVTIHDGSKYIEDTMMEIDKNSGKAVRTLDMKSIFPKSFYKQYDGPGVTDDEVDWLHQNALWYDQGDHSLIISSRHQDTIMKLSYPEGKIKWILADPKGWPKEEQDKLLTPIGTDFKYPGGQHSVMAMPDQDHDPDTLDILMFDNNNVITRGNKSVSQKFSQGVQYRIDEKNMTVKQVWDFGKSRGTDFFSTIVGDDDFLPKTGDRLITSGYIKSQNGMKSNIVEVTDSQPAKVVFELDVTGFKADSHRQIYRALRMPLYPDKWNFDIEDHQ
ncbi:arylsulfate sulfotransferase [Pullulanibacillus pueri]|uniref:Aryl-sulfate sulfotransferase n=1 Tax=Pullulanibacillus pueri TaxID=1437324 RepID=A0A8J2ZUK7_9BACL|nr:aryl-sulfate sulfotransferase [Pullulanibacillus pueri]MBM7681334.1 arylsulfate sulfotransferase [Pullulanibacillus pueri]GGH77551.1 aryl-sulfate sulfotransferase [Pullulanibacillus pueri]